ncbi:MAG: hypothetical protein HY658_12870 [Actinobacteria bacterium]|nr:hypothetical protein [Actinomycetota bacterium]
MERRRVRSAARSSRPRRPSAIGRWRSRRSFRRERRFSGADRRAGRRGRPPLFGNRQDKVLAGLAGLLVAGGLAAFVFLGSNRLGAANIDPDSTNLPTLPTSVPTTDFTDLEPTDTTQPPEESPSKSESASPEETTTRAPTTTPAPPTTTTPAPTTTTTTTVPPTEPTPSFSTEPEPSATDPTFSTEPPPTPDPTEPTIDVTIPPEGD